MKVSVGLPTCMEGMIYPVPFASPEKLVEIARRAEALGYHSVWGNDHMTTQRYVREEFATPPNYWEPLITYAYLAAKTERIRLGTGVLVAPMRRDIVVVAKQLATLDHFSSGRLLVGLGVGAYREEFEALHPGREAQRGPLLEEAIQSLLALFSHRTASFAGKYFAFSDVEMFPKPLQDPLPLYVGGNNPNAVRRAALYGQGWLPAAMPRDQLQERIRRLKELAELSGRDPEALEVAPQFVVRLGASREQAVERFRGSQLCKHLVSLRSSTLRDQATQSFEQANLIGTPAQVVEQGQSLADVGVTHLAGLLFAVNSVQELLDQMVSFAQEVMPHLQDPGV